VDTVKSASPHERKLFRVLRTRQVNRILEEHARKRASESAGDGIYVVICNDPRDVHVVVRAADDAAFTQHDSEELRRTLARRLHDSGPDQALLSLTNQVRATLQAHATRGQSTSVVNEFVLASLLGGGVALWLVLCGVRFKMRGRQAGSVLDDCAPECEPGFSQAAHQPAGCRCKQHAAKTEQHHQQPCLRQGYAVDHMHMRGDEGEGERARLSIEAGTDVPDNVIADVVGSYWFEEVQADLDWDGDEGFDGGGAGGNQRLQG